MKRRTYLALCFAVLFFGQGSAQDWNRLPGGDIINGTEWFGADVGSTVPVRIETRVNESIDWYTNAIQRLTLRPDATYTIGSFPLQVKDGAMLLGGDVAPFLAGAPGPFSALHLIEPNTLNTQAFGYRPWMRNGVTFTGNSDLGYIGHKYGTDQNGAIVDDESDMVIHWSNDNGGEWGPDRLTFRFTTPFSGAATSGSSTVEGLEAMRITPINANNANVGIGDFVAGGGEPTERLDVLTGNVRVRDLPANGPSTSNNYVTVNMATGVLENRPLPLDTDCSWTLQGTGNQNVATAYAGNTGCPQADKGVGIGTSSPTSKLDVIHSETNGSMLGGVNVLFTPDATGDPHGVKVNVSATSVSAPPNINGVLVTTANSANENCAVKATAQQTNTNITSAVVGGNFMADIYGSSTVPSNFGVYGTSREAASSAVTNAFGVYGRALYNKTTAHGVYGISLSTSGNKSYGVYGNGRGATFNYGVNGIADHSNSGSTNYGVRGEALGGGTNFSIWASNPGSGANDWSGYFMGKVHIIGAASCTASAWASDASLKTNIEDLTGATALLSDVRPRNYRFRTEEFPAMDLPSEEEHGVIAQELEEVLPELVKEISLAAIMDSTGAEIQAARVIKGVNYIGLIPILIAAHQEQQSTIEQQQQTIGGLQERMDNLEQLLAACCANPDRALPQPGSDTGLLNDAAPGMEKLRIQPNPFNERTTVFYKLDNGGRTQLMANSADGKELRVLQEATLEKGDYQYEWNTTSLAPGMYYVTLLVDGQPVVKKAVKVDR